jgi:membrane-bound lytic murein transglycosylase D
MKLPSIFILLSSAGIMMAAEEQVMSLDDLLDAGEQWVRDNFDDSFVQALDQVDRSKVQRFFEDLDRTLNSDYVLDLVPLKNTAQTLVPLLQNHPETQPYAAWLKTRLDYFEIADQLRILVVPRPSQSDTPPPARPVLELSTQRRLWTKQMEKRPPPTQAEQFALRFKPIFAAQKVPESLVWLAEVESGFDPTAKSPANAAGLYQLMPATAQTLGLALSPKDERLDPDKNALAAARYLRYLNGRFPEWPLALAAYNVGEGRVQALIERHKTRSFDRLARYLPAETQLYVPKVEATLLRREKVNLAKLKAVPAPP